MTEAFIVRREIEIAAPRATVFAFLTDPQKIVSWMGLEADTELHPGGLYLLKGVSGDRARAARGAFREVVPVHRLAYTFGWEGGEEVPPGSSLIEIDLIDRETGTLLRMTHSGLPNAAQCESHAKGWEHYLGRLKIAAAGGDPGPERGPHQGA
ncbi:SRPBCC domain-containing protein [Bradyrhizobium genosp. L]|uniref:SRPBCC family protein n=1 Tax=Bradyrhizobium genosp. L TaxID=83637 RepID=UPI0018A32A01|nr:SRPBCC family protein [Bradyrhizobium genosp. L]QPF87620.1 SRPBCC domain-containing protein [Bradyrhizobium genosp. L]